MHFALRDDPEMLLDLPRRFPPSLEALSISAPDELLLEILQSLCSKSYLPKLRSLPELDSHGIRPFTAPPELVEQLMKSWFERTTLDEPETDRETLESYLPAPEEQLEEDEDNA